MAVRNFRFGHPEFSNALDANPDALEDFYLSLNSVQRRM